jgi:hypothetical protein
MVPMMGVEPTRPWQDGDFKDRCVYRFTTSAKLGLPAGLEPATIGLVDRCSSGLGSASLES